MTAEPQPDHGTVTAYVTIFTPAAPLFQVPVAYDGWTGDLVSARIEGFDVPRQVLARVLDPEMFARIARMPKAKLAAIAAETEDCK